MEQWLRVWCTADGDLRIDRIEPRTMYWNDVIPKTGDCWQHKETGVDWFVMAHSPKRVLLRYSGMQGTSLSIGIDRLNRDFERRPEAQDPIGWNNGPHQRGPTCTRHFPVHHCDCSTCNLTINQRIALANMKTYRCHKIVQACKILGVDITHKGYLLHLDDSKNTHITAIPPGQFSAAVAGDYYVVYDDAYALRSPAAAFEAGYTEVVPLEPGQYRKRPVVIEAWKIAYDAVTRPQWVRQAFQEQRIDWNADGESMHIATLEGLMYAPMGHMLIRGVKGELYACDPEIFAATYDPA